MPARSNPNRAGAIPANLPRDVLILLSVVWILIMASPLITWRACAKDLPGREIWLPEEEVKDRFFSYLIGLVQVDTCGVLDAEELAAVLSDFKGKTSIPFESIRDIRRECGGQAAGSPRGSNTWREVSITFNEELKTPVPYDILGYHPGSVRASSTVKFREWYIPRRTLRWSNKDPLPLTDIYVFGLYEGWTVIDIDAWLDALLGGALDDTRITTLVLFKYNGQWHGLAAGYGHSNEGRSGVFNFSTNKILFPTPPEFKGLGPYFRNYVAEVKNVKVPLPPSEEWEVKDKR